MFKRLRWLLVGFVLGIATAHWCTARLRRAVARYAPPEVRDRVEAQLGALRTDVRTAIVEGRAAMRRREDELHRTWEAPREVRAG